MSDKVVRIGGASAFWGDSATAVSQLCAVENLDYLVFDYLAELTMSLLAAARMKDANKGYATDFVEIAMREVLASCVARKIRVISNAGGMNPAACARHLAELAQELGVAVRIAVVDGDEVSAAMGELRALGVSDFYSGAPMPQRLISANAYLGAAPIAAALGEGAQVVITGRVVDSAVTLGALMHEFGWSTTEFDLLAQGSLAGHLIECGAQACGGLLTDWRAVPDWAHIGYPILECYADGRFLLTKPTASGGVISVAATAEQLVYEIDDPGAYILPDVVCDFRAVEIKQVDATHVLVTGALGLPPTDFYKVSATWQDGFRCMASLTIVGFAAGAKARRSGQAILARTREMLAARGWPDYTGVELEVLGAGDEEAFGEAILRLAVSHAKREALELFAREIAPAGTSFAPGTTGSLIAGRPAVVPCIRLFSCLIDKGLVSAQLHFEGRDQTLAAPSPSGGAKPTAEPAAQPGELQIETPAGSVEVPLIRIAHGRSGDKGSRCNVGIIAREPRFFDVIAGEVTAKRVRAHLARFVQGEVRRYALPGIGAFNYVLEDALGGGGMASLRNDPLGKAMAQHLLTLRIRIDPALLG